MTDIVDANKEKAINTANILTPNGFDEEWKKLFPLGDKELPALLRNQSE